MLFRSCFVKAGEISAGAFWFIGVATVVAIDALHHRVGRIFGDRVEAHIDRSFAPIQVDPVKCVVCGRKALSFEDLAGQHIADEGIVARAIAKTQIRKAVELLVLGFGVVVLILVKIEAERQFSDARGPRLREGRIALPLRSVISA